MNKPVKCIDEEYGIRMWYGAFPDRGPLAKDSAAKLKSIRMLYGAFPDRGPLAKD